MSLKVYHGKRTRSLRVVWMLEEMGLDYEISRADPPFQQANAEFMSVNPQGTLPAFTDGGSTRVTVPAGSIFVCPRGLWHRQLPRPYVTMLYGTPSQTTEVSWADDPRTGG